MRLTSLRCRAFRGLAAIDFAPGAGVNIVYGANAQGKTSLLEAALYAATTRSHRTAADAELANHAGREFHIEIQAAGRDRELRIEAHWFNDAKRFKVNGLAQTRLSDILGRLCVVFFSPEDIGIIKGAASGRRLFLDMELSQLQPPYLRALQQYRQALRQRNELLRRDCRDGDLLSLWESQLAEHGGTLMRERARYIDELEELAAPLYAQIVEREPLHLTYHPDVANVGDIEATLQRSRKTDLLRKTTGRGPHRDDVDIMIADRSARIYGSQGQQKSAALVIKLADVALMRRRMGEYPVILLDEALAELDSERGRRLLAVIPDEAQAIITAAQPEQALAALKDQCRLFLMEGGRLEAR